MTDNVFTTLVKVRQLLSDPKNWTQGANARNTRGVEVPPEDDKAVCWCLNGALLRIAGQNQRHTYRHLNVSLQMLPYEDELTFSLCVFNDNVEHRHVLKLLDYAIERASKENV